MVVGVTSFHVDGCFEDQPLIYTEVSEYTDWIEQTIKIE